jgi:hypothetical protein
LLLNIGVERLFRIGSIVILVKNNLCGLFNYATLRATLYQIISSMEIISRKVTTRLAKNKAKSQGWTRIVFPNIFKKLKINVKRSNIFQVFYNGTEGFEVMKGHHRRVSVNFNRFTCSCRYWDLSGFFHVSMLLVLYTLLVENWLLS